MLPRPEDRVVIVPPNFTQCLQLQLSGSFRVHPAVAPNMRLSARIINMYIKLFRVIPKRHSLVLQHTNI
ncbi:hypothetical protein ALP61_200120 [Pseudomonas savastanoi]|nr:hypothetical protein ALP61_200120 [Pseudomonas savastanoi]